jgi:hypothetical protein
MIRKARLSGHIPADAVGLPTWQVPALVAAAWHEAGTSDADHCRPLG